MACNQDLKNEGKEYPRTCADCGFGPCKKYGVDPKPDATLTPDQMMAALDAMAGPGKVQMRKPGDWICSHSVDVRDGSVLVGFFGNGTTPQEAIKSQWLGLTQLKEGQYLVTRAHGARVRWNGFMWAAVQSEAA
jgi:hypothetical protein